MRADVCAAVQSRTAAAPLFRTLPCPCASPPPCLYVKQTNKRRRKQTNAGGRFATGGKTAAASAADNRRLLPRPISRLLAGIRAIPPPPPALPVISIAAAMFASRHLVILHGVDILPAVIIRPPRLAPRIRLAACRAAILAAPYPRRRRVNARR